MLEESVGLTLPDSEHLGATYRTDTLSSWLAVLHGYGPAVLYFPLGTTFHAISLHSLPPFSTKHRTLPMRLSIT